jgi:hypothetical protein
LKINDEEADKEALKEIMGFKGEKVQTENKQDNTYIMRSGCLSHPPQCLIESAYVALNESYQTLMLATVH